MLLYIVERVLTVANITFIHKMIWGEAETVAILAKGIFSDINEINLEQMQTCFDMRLRSYQPGERILSFEEPTSDVGVLLSGTAVVMRVQENGVQTLMEYLGPGDVFGAVFFTYSVSPGSYSVYCKEAARIQFFDFRHVFTPCAKACKCHSRLIENFLLMLSRKTTVLSERLEILSRRSIRDKLKGYFHIMSVKCGSDRFELPFSLSTLAEYLCTDRSAMMRELKKLREEGIVEVNRHMVRILSLEELSD